MVRQGYAFEYTFDLPYAYQAAFRQAERTARQQERGLWSPDTCAGQQIPADATPAPATATPEPAVGCDPSYPDICLPPPPPDLDCREISERRFRVLPPDPHNLDGNDDGVACEG
jgi:micrococcal nuclease